MGDSGKAEAAKESSDAVDDLDNLLDSALTDFDRPLPKVPLQTSASNTKDGTSNSKSSEENAAGEEWGAEFSQFQNMMDALMKGNANFENLGLPDNPEVEGAAGNDLSASLAETLKAISDSAQNISEQPNPDFTQMFKNMNLEEGDATKPDQVPDLMPLMENVMQSLLSKELLYPSLKDIVNKYPDYLADKQATLDEETFQKYTSQYKIMKEVCEEFEAGDSASSDDSTTSFSKVLTLMQKMQECGNPPKELVGDVPSDLPFDEDGNFKLPGMPDQCTIM